MKIECAAEQIEVLAGEARRQFSGAEIDFQVSPSGSADLGLRVAGRYFTVMYSAPHDVYCVDELTADEDAGFNTGYRYGFHEFEPAAECFRGLLATIDAEDR